MCFELLGFDVIIKKSLRPFVLEVNHAPSFNTDTPYDMKVKGEMLKNMFELLDCTVAQRNVLIDLDHQRIEER